MAVGKLQAQTGKLPRMVGHTAKPVATAFNLAADSTRSSSSHFPLGSRAVTPIRAGLQKWQRSPLLPSTFVSRLPHLDDRQWEKRWTSIKRFPPYILRPARPLVGMPKLAGQLFRLPLSSPNHSHRASGSQLPPRDDRCSPWAPYGTMPLTTSKTSTTMLTRSDRHAPSSSPTSSD